MLVMFIVGLMFVGCLALYASAQFGSQDTHSMEQKNSVFDAAEAGLEDGVNALDVASSATGGSGTLTNGDSFNYTITTNATGLPQSESDGINFITLPTGYSLIVSTGTVASQRPTIAEAIVKGGGFNYSLNNVAVEVNGNVTGNWNGKIGLSGSDGSQSGGADDANIYANGTISASVGFEDGWAKSAGANSLIGTAGAGSAANAPTVSMPAPGDLAKYVAQERTLVGSGNGTTLIYTTTFPGTSTYTCPTSPIPNGGKGCAMFIDAGSVGNTQSVPTFNGPWTVVVNGDYSSTGHGGIAFQDPSPVGAWKPSLFLVNGSADLGGNASASALIWAAGDVTLHGNGNVYGAIISEGNVVMNGGGSGGGFQYDKNLSGYSLSIPGHYAITAYGEY
jgi:hypothetical protein